MSKPRDPVLAVIAYFETAELPLARQTLAIVQQTVKRRTPTKAISNATRSKKHNGAGDHAPAVVANER